MLRRKNSAEKQMDIPPTSSGTNILAVLLLTSSFFTVVQSSRNLTIVNNCRRTIWPVIAPSATFGPNAFILKSNESKTVTVPEDWTGRIWGRTHCYTNSSTGNFSCLTGDCGSGKLEYCEKQGTPPVTLAEFRIAETDYYDVTVVDGFNLPMLVVPQARARGNCNATGCITDLNKQCPWELTKASGNGNETIACMSACQAFGYPMPCCYGSSTGENCRRPTLYNSYFKNACPQAYSFAYDDQTSLFACTSAEDYSIIFCPPPNSSLLPGAAPPPAPGNDALVPKTIKKSRSWIRFYIAPAASLLLLAFLCAFCYRRRNIRVIIRRMSRVQSRKQKDKGEKDSLIFSYATIESATNYFSDENILGRGGYGQVYKGKLLNGQEIAVKRLQKMSGHGIEQFKNEVSVISKLQHRNLVRLLGYCSDNNERILIYEYLPNKSLDSILFDAEKRSTLGWKSRLEIIEGIAQGLLYLHKYSRLKIIHRDLKTSNILLDKDLNPKISDFGTAKIFGDDESCANTNRIVGTHGYMAPEYAMDGIFSMKSDVFSFGVMMLEIISGKKNTGFYNSDRHINLLGYVWDLWNEERFLEITDPNLAETISVREVVRYVQVALLCVQENANDRPNMSDVVSMLQNETMSLPAPRQPSFTAILSVTNAELCRNIQPTTVNMVTISDVNGR